MIMHGWIRISKYAWTIKWKTKINI
jgi:hypothetical protein